MSSTFMGKYAFLSSNTVGQQYYMTLDEGSGVNPLVSMSAESLTEQEEWIAYDAGGGAVLFATARPNPLYFYIDSGLGWVMASSSLAGAVAIKMESAGGSENLVSWQALISGQWQEASYLVGTSFSGVVFPVQGSTPGPSPLTTFQQVVITPGLAQIQSSKFAQKYDFQGVDLTGASFAGVDCTNANFTGAILAGVDFTGATLTNAIFTGTDLTGVIWGNNIQAAGAVFTNCIGRNVVFPSTSQSLPDQANFTGATFTEADFSGANFTNANLSGAFLYGADFSGATLAGATLAGANGGQSLSGQFLGVDLSRAYMPDVNLREAHLEGADLSHAQIYYISTGALDSAFLIETNLTGADLTGMSFKSTTIQGVNFNDATLIGCNFDSVAFQPSPNYLPVSMVGAHLEGAQFTGTTTLSQVHLTDASIAVGTGVPLFTAPMQASYATALNTNTLPGAFTSLFAEQGYLLSPTASVAPGGAQSQWILQQNPLSQTLGVEIVGYYLISSGTELSIYSYYLSLTEQGDGNITYNIQLGVSPTGLPQSILDSYTRCPNRATVQTNSQLGLSWEVMLTVIKLPLASLNSL